MYGLDFSKFRRDRKLSDVAAEVKAQNVHWGVSRKFSKPPIRRSQSSSSGVAS